MTDVNSGASQEAIEFHYDMPAEFFALWLGRSMTYTAARFTAPGMTLDAAQEKQWKQIGSDPTGLRLQVRFVKKDHGARVGFQVADIRATVPDAPSLAIGPSPTAAATAVS